MSQQGEDGESGHFVDKTLKGINWLPYSQSPRPYAIFRETAYSIMLSSEPSRASSYQGSCYSDAFSTISYSVLLGSVTIELHIV